jgi:hypothetical protein
MKLQIILVIHRSRIFFLYYKINRLVLKKECEARDKENFMGMVPGGAANPFVLGRCLWAT